MESFIPLDWNALHVYAAKGDLEAVQCLLEVGLYGDTALHLAAGNGQKSVVTLLVQYQADPSRQNDLGQTPLFTAAIFGETEIARILIAAGADVLRLSIDGRIARDVAANDECRFLFRALGSAEDDEEKDLAEQRRIRLERVLLNWMKAAMVSAFRSWRSFALLPHNQIDRLLEEMSSFARDQLILNPTGLVDMETVEGPDDACEGIQCVLYAGRRGLGTPGGSGHPMLLRLAPPELLAAERPHAAAARLGGPSRRPPHWRIGVETADPILWRLCRTQPSLRAQAEELEDDGWGRRSIGTARHWARRLIRLFATARQMPRRFWFLMDERPPASPLSFLALIQAGLADLLDRLTRPHRTMLLGLRPRAFRPAVAFAPAQLLATSGAFPPNLGGAPSDRRLFAARFVHLWAWLMACYQPPGYTALQDLQEELGAAAQALGVQELPIVAYVLDPAFRPRAEGDRQHVQTMNLALPPRAAEYLGGMGEAWGAYYAKAVCKVPGEPSVPSVAEHGTERDEGKDVAGLEQRRAFPAGLLFDPSAH